MSRLPAIATLLGICLTMISCALPRNHSQLMRGKVAGGDVPLYLMGGLSDFMKAGLVLPSFDGYLRTEYEVLDIAKNGTITPATGKGEEPFAQLAIPTLVSSMLLPEGYEVRYAMPAHSDEPFHSIAASGTEKRPSTSPARSVKKSSAPATEEIRKAQPVFDSPLPDTDSTLAATAGLTVRTDSAFF